MIIVMERGATKEQIQHVFDRIRELGYDVHPIYGVERTVIGAIGDERGKSRLQVLESVPGVEKVVPILKPFKLVGRELRQQRSVVQIRHIGVGSDQLAIMAGPCSVENREQILTTAKIVKEAGAQFLRGGAFKPRTSPYDFQGLEIEGLKLLAEAREQTGLLVVTEVMNPRDILSVAKYADLIQIGARNMQNFSLLKEVGQANKPILLKRGIMAKVQELLMAAEYLAAQGHHNVILCERGIRTFEDATRNTLDLSAVPLLRELTHLPVIVDPSHGCGIRSLVPPLAKAAVAAGADGLLIEVHPNPEEALSDGQQSLFPDQFSALMKDVRKYAELEGRYI